MLWPKVVGVGSVEGGSESVGEVSSSVGITGEVAMLRSYSSSASESWYAEAKAMAIFLSVSAAISLELTFTHGASLEGLAAGRPQLPSKKRDCDLHTQALLRMETDVSMRSGTWMFGVRLRALFVSTRDETAADGTEKVTESLWSEIRSVGGL